MSKIGLKQTSLFKKLLHIGKVQAVADQALNSIHMLRGEKKGLEKQILASRPCRKITLSQRLFSHSLNLVFDHVFKLELKVFMIIVDVVVTRHILQYKDDKERTGYKFKGKNKT